MESNEELIRAVAERLSDPDIVAGIVENILNQLKERGVPVFTCPPEPEPPAEHLPSRDPGEPRLFRAVRQARKFFVDFFANRVTRG